MPENTPAAGSSSAPQFSFITTCKGRLAHLQRTLPLLAQQTNCEVIVVDYNCPQKSGDWVEQHHPGVKVVRVTDDDGFLLARARNIGARASTAPWLVFIDADILLTGDLLSWLPRHLAPHTFFRPAEDDFNLYGSFVCHRSDFENTGGYDELLQGWGREDKDVYYRLTRAGCRQENFPAGFLTAIKHGDEDRTQFYPYKDKTDSQIISTLYLQMKYDLQDLSPGQATPETLRKLYERARDTILQGLGQSASQGMKVKLMLGEVPGPSTINQLYGIERAVVYLVKKHRQRSLP